MDFNLDAWLESTRLIPQDHIAECLRAVNDRYILIQEEPRIFAARNDTARTYHASIAHDLIDGVPVWTRPIADFAGWPTGAEVHHADQVWVNVHDDVAMGEPGVDPVWQTITVLSEALGKQSAALVKLSEVVIAQNTRIAELERPTGEG